MENKKHILMVKTHTITKLKYLCKMSTFDIDKAYTYTGSGKYWKNHINKHGKFIKTKIIGIFNNQKELKIKGIFYSKKWNIIKSKNWANLKNEEGDGGDTYSCLSLEQKLRRNHLIGTRVKQSILTSLKRKIADKNRRDRKRRGDFTVNEKRWYSKLSKIRKGRPEFFKNAKLALAKIPRTKKWIQKQILTKQQKFPIFFSLKKDRSVYNFSNYASAKKLLHVTTTGLNHLIKGRQKTHKGYILAS